MSGSAELPAPDFPPTAEPCGRVWGQPRWVASLLVHCGGLRRRSGLHLSPHPPPPQGPPAAFPLLARVCVQLHDAGRSSRRVSTAPESETMRSGVGFGLSFQAPAHAFGVPLCLPPVVRPSSLVILGTAGPGTEREDSSLTETTASSRS